MRNIYMTDWGEVSVSENEAAILSADDYICQRRGGNEGYIPVMRRADAIRKACRAFAKDKWQRSRPAYFWLGAEADA